ncbi:MAG: hypothetical protein A4E40_00133 [Methanoregulaceae archaeon PtaU1.Bin059]|nr:MAG: hypothetical protein A4E40_00133 [Methanoregulaceae archaeon PtaU1.Bin059]
MNCYFFIHILRDYNHYYLLYHIQRTIHMMRGHLIAGTILLLLFAVVVQGAFAGVVERSVEPAEQSTYRVVLTIAGERVAGITEVLPPGTEVREVSLPAGQYRVDGTTLFLAVIGEPEITYVVRAPEDPTGAIRGTWTDFVLDEGGTVAGHADGTESPQVPSAAPLTAGTPKAAPSLLLLLAGTMAGMACAARCRGKGGMRR